MKITFNPDNSNEYINQDVSSCLSHPVHLLISVLANTITQDERAFKNVNVLLKCFHYK